MSRTRTSIIGPRPAIPAAKAAADGISSNEAPTVARPTAPIAPMPAASGRKTREVGKRSWIAPHVGELISATAEVNAARAPIVPREIPRLL
jgi:hypothetical protein